VRFFIDLEFGDTASVVTLVSVAAVAEDGREYYAVSSEFDPLARSSKGAQGLMQLMPATAKRYGISDLRDPYQSLRAGAAHLRDLLDQYEGNVTLALAAYNAGSGAVKRYGGVPAYEETQQYVKKVQAKMGRTPRKNEGRVVSSKNAKIEMRVQPDGTVVLSN